MPPVVETVPQTGGTQLLKNANNIANLCGKIKQAILGSCAIVNTYFVFDAEKPLGGWESYVLCRE
jgi:hypothetical protein